MEKENESLYFSIISSLAQKGICEVVDITSLFDNYFIKPKTAGDAAWSKRQNDIISYLNKIKSNGHITYDYKSLEVESKPDWIKPFVVTAEITQYGLDYYYEHTIRTKTIKSLNNQFIYNLITWCIAILAAGFSGYSITQKDEISTELNRIKQELQQMKYQPHSQVATHKTADTTYRKK